jgi:beta-glucanase (GH16 family)
MYFVLLLSLPCLLAAQPQGNTPEVGIGSAGKLSVRGSLSNGYYSARMFCLRTFQPDRLHRGRKARVPVNYNTAFEDSFNTLNRNVWRIGQPWGRIHPGQIHEWYSDEAVTSDSGILQLRAFYKPAILQVNNRDTLVPFQVGLICSDISFSSHYGYFEIRSMNPSGPASWPAFWLAPAQGWPPEIDILEMYGKKDGSSIHRLTNSLHYGSIEAGNKSETIRGIRLPEDTDRRFYTYACLWQPRSIRFYVNGYTVGKVRLSRDLAATMNQPMYLILNNALQGDYIKYLGNQPEPQVFRVDYVRVLAPGHM